MKKNKKLIFYVLIVILFFVAVYFAGRNSGENKNNIEQEKKIVDSVVSESANQYVEIAKKLVAEALLENFKRQGGVLDYRINDIKFVADRSTREQYYLDAFYSEDSKDVFMVTVDYSVQAKVNPGEMNIWSAGNGEEGKDGWILNKFQYFKIDRNSMGDYFATIMGTGL